MLDAQWVWGLMDNQEADFLLHWVDHDDWEISPLLVRPLVVAGPVDSQLLC
jgi:hypothetical protein